MLYSLWAWDAHSLLSPLSMSTPVLESREHCIETLGRGLGTSREVYDQSAASQAGDASGKHASRRNLYACGAHRLGYARRHPVDDRLGRLRGHVSPREPGAAGGNGETHVQLIGAVDEFALNKLEFIRHDVAVDDFPAVFLEHGLDSRAAGILALSPAALVADRYHGRSVPYLIAHITVSLSLYTAPCAYLYGL